MYKKKEEGAIFELLMNFKFDICKGIAFKYFLHAHSLTRSVIQSPVSSNELVTSLKRLVTFRHPRKYIYLFSYTISVCPIYQFSTTCLTFDPPPCGCVWFFSYLVENFLVVKLYIQPVDKADTATFAIAREQLFQTLKPCGSAEEGPAVTREPSEVTASVRCCFHFLHSSLLGSGWSEWNCGKSQRSSVEVTKTASLFLDVKIWTLNVTLFCCQVL